MSIYTCSFLHPDVADATVQQTETSPVFGLSKKQWRSFRPETWEPQRRQQGWGFLGREKIVPLPTS